MPIADYSLIFTCPTCGAHPREKCTLQNGDPRFGSHIERWNIVKDYLFSTTFRETNALSIRMESKPQG
jgi:hypothetical protein